MEIAKVRNYHKSKETRESWEDSRVIAIEWVIPSSSAVPRFILPWLIGVPEGIESVWIVLIVSLLEGSLGLVVVLLIGLSLFFGKFFFILIDYLLKGLMLFLDFLQERRLLFILFSVPLLGFELLDPLLYFLNFLEGPVFASSQLSVCYAFYKCY